MLIDEPKTLSANELYTMLGIAKSTWDKKRNDILKYLEDYFDIEILGNKTKVLCG